MPTLIGINGFKKSGKDTTFGLIQNLIAAQETAKRVAFADKLKQLGALALGFEGTPEELIAHMDDAKDNWELHLMRRESEDGHPGLRFFHYTSGREYLQDIGNHARRLFGDTFWIDQVLPTPDGVMRQGAPPTLGARYPGADIVCVTDVRYANEAERVLALGGVVWEVVRPEATSDGHDSEQPLPRELVTRTIDNSGTLGDLEAEVDAALTTVGF